MCIFFIFTQTMCAFTILCSFTLFSLLGPINLVLRYFVAKSLLQITCFFLCEFYSPQILFSANFARVKEMTNIKYVLAFVGKCWQVLESFCMFWQVLASFGKFCKFWHFLVDPPSHFRAMPEFKCFFVVMSSQ